MKGKQFFRGKVPVALCYLLTTMAFAQSEQDIKNIQRKSDLIGLNSLKNQIGKTTPSASQLKVEARRKNVPFRGNFEGKSYQLQGFDDRGNPIYYVTYNAGANEGTSVSKINSEGGIFNLDGDGIILHEWDGGGVRVSHQEFGGRVTQEDNAAQEIEHSTHVAGTMVAKGVNSSAKGMAPKAKLKAYEWTYDRKEAIDAAMNGAIVSNHSYGASGGFDKGNYGGTLGWYWFGSDDDLEYIGFGHYSKIDAFWDLISLRAPYYLPVRAAGNARGSGPAPGQSHFVRVEENGVKVWKPSRKIRQINGGRYGYDSILNESLAKNVLTVGAAHKIEGGYKSPQDVRPASFSGFGPTDDGRIKPDIMGIGVGVFSTTNEGDNQYSSLSGTSMAAPNVSGALGLLQEHHKKMYGDFMKSATLKGLAIHTADEAGSNDGPDYSNGWGLLNAFKAVQTISSKDKYTLINEEILENSKVKEFSVVASGTEPLKITICWDDAVMENLPTYTLNNRTLTLVNDLDIRVTDGTNEYFPWILDPEKPRAAAKKGDNFRDNVEQIVIPNPEKGKTYTIKVSHKGKLKTNLNENDSITLVDTDSQAFSMIVTGINNGVKKDLEVASISVPNAMEFSTQTPIEVRINNLSESPVSGAKLKFYLMNNDENKVEQQGEVALEEIGVGSSIIKSIELDLSKGFVNYNIVVEVVAEGDAIDANNKQSTKVYGVIADVTEEGSRYDYGFETPLDKNGWTVEDVNGDGASWSIHEEQGLGKSGNGFASNFQNYATGANDWLFSNPIKMKGNVKYRIVSNVRKLEAKIKEQLNIFIGETPTFEEMTTKIGETIEASEKGYERYVYEFTPKKDGLYYVGFQHLKPENESSYAIMLDDVSVQFSEGKPAADFTVSVSDPSSFDEVTLVNETLTESHLPVTAYEWSFNPNTITFVDGYNANSESPKVVFNQEGTYDITLKAVNARGEGSITKNRRVEVSNLEVDAYFTVESVQIYQGSTIRLSDKSVGKPVPNQWKWSITPEKGFEFVGGTTAESQHPLIKFNASGIYTLNLAATSPFGTNNFGFKIQVKPVYNSIKNGAISFDKNSNTIGLNWERPNLIPIYEEGFEGSRTDLPYDFAVEDEDKNGVSWSLLPFAAGAHTGRRAAYSVSMKKDRVSNWMATGKIAKGAEVFRFWHKNEGKERLDVYLVPATSTAGEKPTLEEMKSGHKLKEMVIDGSKDYRKVEIDVSQYADTEYYIVLHHKTTPSDVTAPIMSWLLVDDMEVNIKDNYSVFAKNANNVTDAEQEELEKIMYGKKYNPIYKLMSNQNEAEESPVVNRNLPRLSGYEVMKEGEVLKTTSDIKDKAYQQVVNRTGTHTYDVYALYTDGKKSNPIKLSVEVSTLSTSDVKGNDALKIYPNPSNGIFVVETPTGVSSLKAEVYDMSGKLILKKGFEGNKAEFNLTQYSKGMYILNLVDNRGEKYSAKLMIK